MASACKKHARGHRKTTKRVASRKPVKRVAARTSCPKKTTRRVVASRKTVVRKKTVQRVAGSRQSVYQVSPQIADRRPSYTESYRPAPARYAPERECDSRPARVRYVPVERVRYVPVERVRYVPVRRVRRVEVCEPVRRPRYERVSYGYDCGDCRESFRTRYRLTDHYRVSRCD
jgi:hypothetical protein